MPADASSSIANAGGQLVQSYDQIGVAVAVSSNASFRDNLRYDSRVADAAQTRPGGIRMKDRQPDDLEAPVPSVAASQPTIDTGGLGSKQWDMRQIRAPEAHRITTGSRSVLVADIDTGIDYKHPDLAPNIDFGASVSCVGGRPNQSPAAWADDIGHGTHTAGTIAAAGNGEGIIGVAPSVRIAAIKASNAEGFFYPEAIVCAFMWAATHGVNVTNNSYFADPFYFNCPNDKDARFRQRERVLLLAESLAIRFAQRRGVAVIASAENFRDDLANPTQDRQSPDDATTPETRPVDKSCKVIPVMLPGVIGVSADGNLRKKAYYSNYGLGIIDVTAPGGDRKLQVTREAPNGGVLSTVPPNLCSPTLTVKRSTGSPDYPTAYYCYAQGTSMAAPHVTGVAALLLSRFGNQRGEDSEDGHSTSHLRRLIDLSTNSIACPATVPPKDYPPSANNDAPQTCTGSPRHNSWYGYGEINALKAVTGGERDD